jgi:hypothetical protein
LRVEDPVAPGRRFAFLVATFLARETIGRQKLDLRLEILEVLTFLPDLQLVILQRRPDECLIFPVADLRREDFLNRILVLEMFVDILRQSKVEIAREEDGMGLFQKLRVVGLFQQLLMELVKVFDSGAVVAEPALEAAVYKAEWGVVGLEEEGLSAV